MSLKSLRIHAYILLLVYINCICATNVGPAASSSWNPTDDSIEEKHRTRGPWFGWNVTLAGVQASSSSRSRSLDLIEDLLKSRLPAGIEFLEYPSEPLQVGIQRKPKEDWEWLFDGVGPQASSN